MKRRTFLGVAAGTTAGFAGIGGRNANKVVSAQAKNLTGNSVLDKDGKLAGKR